MRCLSRSTSAALLACATALAGCTGARPAPHAPLLPPLAAWKTLLDESVVAPLAADGRRVFVATRDGAVRALDPATGAQLWRVEGLPGRLSASEGVLIVRGETGALASLHPRTSQLRWRTETPVAGALPALVDGDRVHVAGRGFASLIVETGAPVFVDGAGPETTAPPLAAQGRVFTGEADGSLRCRDRATGAVVWTLPTRSALAAPPLVDTRRKRLYLGTTDKRILEVSLADGEGGWSWRIGADASEAGLLYRGRVLFAPKDAVLYALEAGGNLAWRVALPSRPLSAPLLVDGRVVIACLENLLVSVDPDAGTLEGSFKTPAEIRAAPILAGGLLVLGLRDRSVIAYAPAGKAAPADEPAAPLAPPVEASPRGR